MTGRSSFRRLSIRLRHSLRAGLVAILIFGVLLGSAVNSANTQRRAVAALRRAGHSVWYRSQWASPVKPNGVTWWPRPIVDALGVDYFDRVVAVVGRKGPTDLELELVAQFGRLEVVALNDSPATDAGLVHLESLRALQALHIRGERFTDAALKRLGRIKGLESVSLRAPGFTDAGLAQLASVSGLRRIQIEHPGITDAAIYELNQALPRVTVIRTP